MTAATSTNTHRNNNHREEKEAMTMTTATTHLREGVYGPNFDRHGVCVDHVRDAIDAGYTLRVFASGTTYVVGIDPNGNAVRVPVVCGDIVRVFTEDGPSDGRCGAPVMHDAGACPGHAAERDAYFAMSETERFYFERIEDGVAR